MKYIYQKIKYLILGYCHIILGLRSSHRDKIELKRLLNKRRFEPGVLLTKDYRIHYSDSLSLYHQYREIVQNKIYEWCKDHDGNYYIIDCGANIGLSTLYLSKTYPKSNILAFEPNPYIYSFLEMNTQSKKNIKLRHEAVWTQNSMVSFNTDKADASSITIGDKGNNIIVVPSVRLYDHITKPVDFLKIDIEGAEYHVLKDIKDKLIFVKNIFIEYHVENLDNTKLNEILSLLTDSDFKYYLKPESVSPSPFQHIKKPSDNFYYQINIFGFK